MTVGLIMYPLEAAENDHHLMLACYRYTAINVYVVWYEPIGNVLFFSDYNAANNAGGNLISNSITW